MPSMYCYVLYAIWDKSYYETECSIIGIFDTLSSAESAGAGRANHHVKKYKMNTKDSSAKSLLFEYWDCRCSLCIARGKAIVDAENKNRKSNWNQRNKKLVELQTFCTALDAASDDVNNSTSFMPFTKNDMLQTLRKLKDATQRYLDCTMNEEASQRTELSKICKTVQKSSTIYLSPLHHLAESLNTIVEWLQ